MRYKFFDIRYKIKFENVVYILESNTLVSTVICCLSIASYDSQILLEDFLLLSLKHLLNISC